MAAGCSFYSEGPGMGNHVSPLNLESLALNRDAYDIDFSIRLIERLISYLGAYKYSAGAHSVVFSLLHSLKSLHSFLIIEKERGSSSSLQGIHGPLNPSDDIEVTTI